MRLFEVKGRRENEGSGVRWWLGDDDGMVVVVGDKETLCATRRMAGPESRSDRRTSSSLSSTVSDAGRGSNEDVILSKYITRITIDLILKV